MTRRAGLVIFAMLLVCGGGSRARGAAEVTVSAAVSLQEALTEAAHAYRAETGRTVSLNFGATGHLLAQIRDGAPVDGFVSASLGQFEQAARMGLVRRDNAVAIASNQLVLVVPPDSKIDLKDFRSLATARVKRLAIGQPRTVPAGEYAEQALRHARIAESVRDRVVYGSSVRQVLDYVIRGEVDAGIVYATDGRQAGDQVRVVATAPPGSHDAIFYMLAVVTESPHAREVAQFRKFLVGEAAQKIFAAHGFASPFAPPRPSPAAAGGATTRATTSPVAAPAPTPAPQS